MELVEKLSPILALTKLSPTRATGLSSLQIFSIIFIAILILHAPLLQLPFFWDEAGFYVPAAHELATLHTVIPTTTIDDPNRE